MAKYPSMPLFTDAFISDTMHLNAAQTGAYLMLLMCAWRTKDGSLPDDDRQLSRFARMNLRTWKANKEIVMSFWRLNDEQKWVQGRLLDERNYVAVNAYKNSLAGKASALKRKERDATSVLPKSNQTSTPIPTPTPSKKKVLTKVSTKKEKVSLNELSISHIETWLNEKRACGKYLTIDEHRLLEKFKDYCTSKGKKYKDHVAGFRNAFEWNDPPTKGNHNGKEERSVEEIGRAVAAEYYTYPDDEQPAIEHNREHQT